MLFHSMSILYLKCFDLRRAAEEELIQQKITIKLFGELERTSLKTTFKDELSQFNLVGADRVQMGLREAK